MLDIILQSIAIGFAIVAFLLITKTPLKALVAHLTFMKHFGEAEVGLEPSMFRRDGCRYFFNLNKIQIHVKHTKLHIIEIVVNGNTVTGLKFGCRDYIYPNLKSLKDRINFGLNFKLKYWSYLQGELTLNTDVIEYHLAMHELERLMKTVNACAIYLSKNIDTGEDPVEYAMRYRK